MGRASGAPLRRGGASPERSVRAAGPAAGPAAGAKGAAQRSQMRERFGTAGENKQKKETDPTRAVNAPIVPSGRVGVVFYFVMVGCC